MSGRIQWKKMAGKLSPYTIKKGLLYLRHYGIREFWIRLHERFEPEEVPYGPWFEATRPDAECLARQRSRRWSSDPVTFSLAVPAWHTDPVFLEQMIDSVLAQTYPFWELCIVNASPEDEHMRQILSRYPAADKRIRIKELRQNLGISGNTNAAFDMCTGDWIGLLDHDDLLSPQTLYLAADLLAREPDTELIYTDEDKVTEDPEAHFQPHFKPDFNLDLLRSNNYICHFLLLRRTLLDRIGGMDTAFDGAQDYDLIFRACESAHAIRHIPEILYHWRTHSQSTADNPVSKMYAFEAGRRAIQAHLSRCGCVGEVTQTKDYGFYRVRYPVQGEPLVSVIIPNKDHPELLRACLDSIRNMTTWQRYEILIVENNSEGEEIFSFYKEAEKDPHVRILTYQGSFNYSKINNEAAKQARGEYLLFLNNDVTVITPDWMEEMLGVCQRPEVGAVGARLHYPDGTIQHAGIVIGMGGIAGSLFVDMPAERSGYLHKASIMQDLSAVTAACMMVPAQAFAQAGGFTPDLAVAFNDVDLCLKLGRLGLLVVYDPFVRMWHAESRTRGPEDTPEKVRRFQSEIEYMRVHWIDLLKNGDPCYNKNLSLTKWNYSIRPKE
ncbi:MAG: glycosyltransferase family 2 protein [Blautia sp.]|nr:glycosyltransferase family 2 protein [Blautia sp.]